MLGPVDQPLRSRLTNLLLAVSRRRLTFVQGQLVAGLAIVLAVGGRWAAFPILGAEVSFITAVPAVMLATAFGGALAGLTTVVAGSALDLLISIQNGHEGLVQAVPRLIVWLSCAAAIMAITVQLRAVLKRLATRENELEASSGRLELLIHELEHRGRNALTIVQALSNEVARSAPSVSDYRRQLGGRLAALATSYSALTRVADRPVEVQALIQDVLKPFGRQISIEPGPDCCVPAQASLPLSLALHELATNATKYGALSVASGIVTIKWSIADQRLLDVFWIETGGPAPKAVSPEGFGSTLLRNIFKQTSGGAFRSQWRPQGMSFQLTMKASPVTASPRGAKVPSLVAVNENSRR